jgi:hypothetical protein
MKSGSLCLRIWAVIGATALATAVASAAPSEQLRTVSGTVTAVTLPSKTIVVEAKVGDSTMTVGAEVPDGTAIKGAKSLADISAGDRVTLEYVRSDKGLIAKSINRMSPK